MEIEDKHSQYSFKGKTRLLFVPTTDRDCEMFAALTEYLTNASITTISLDNLYKIGDGTAHKLDHFTIPYIKISFDDDIPSIIKKINPSILIVSNDGSVIERSFVLAANKFAIPTLLIQVGCFSPLREKRTLYRMFKGLEFNLLKIVFSTSILKTWHTKYSLLLKTLISINEKQRASAIESFFRMAMRDIFSNDERGRYCEYISVNSDYDKMALTYKGMDSDKIFVTGSPKYSKITRVSYSDSEIRKTLNLDENLKIIVFLTPALADHGCMTKKSSDCQIRDTIKQLINLEGVHIIIKVHPNESKEDYVKLLEDYAFNLTFIKHEIELYSLMYIADLIIAINSTCIVESIIMGKQVVNLNYIADTVAPELQEYDLIRCVYNIDNLTDQVNSCLTNESEIEYFHQMRNKFFSANSSLSPEKNGAEDLAELIDHIANEAKYFSIV